MRQTLVTESCHITYKELNKCLSCTVHCHELDKKKGQFNCYHLRITISSLRLQKTFICEQEGLFNTFACRDLAVLIVNKLCTVAVFYYFIYFRKL